MADAPKTRDELKELRARAMAESRYARVGDKPINWDGLYIETKDEWRRLAEATMRAEADAGLGVVQYVPTDEMVNAGIAGAKTAGYTVHPDAAHFVLNAGIKAGDLLGGGGGLRDG